jgi:hypothetical protein
VRLFGRGDEIERRLAAGRPEPSDELVGGVVRRLEAARRPRISSRVAFVAAAVTLLLGTVASFGGAAYADSNGAAAAKSSAADQYGEEKPAKPSTPGGPGGVATGRTPPTAVAAGVQGGSLPFTGISLAVTTIVALGLIGTGVAIRRVERRRAEVRGR